MATKSPKVQIQFINQALAQAQANLTQAKTLMRELEESLAAVLPSSRDIPGIIGKFDGVYLVTDDGKKFQVPENYAGKSKLVYGDTLKMIEDVSGGPSTFKQIERVPRTTLSGILVKKDGKLVAVTSDGSHSLLPAAVSFHHGEEGDSVMVIVPENARNCSFAALDAIPARDLPVVELPVKPVESKGEVKVEAKPKEEKKSKVSESREEEIKKAFAEETKKEGSKKESKAAAKKEQKEQVSSITVEPDGSTSGERPETSKPAPKAAPKKAPDLPLVKPLPPKAPVTPAAPTTPAPSVGTVNSILGDDDLR